MKNANLFAAMKLAVWVIHSTTNSPDAVWTALFWHLQRCIRKRGNGSRRIAETQKTGKRHFIIIVAEGVGHAQEIANEIQARTGIDSRATILGHVQRGGSPTLRDRVNASAMGYHAVCLLEQGKYNRIVGMKGEKLVDYPVDEALEMTKTLDPVLIDVCNTISI